MAYITREFLPIDRRLSADAIGAQIGALFTDLHLGVVEMNAQRDEVNGFAASAALRCAEASLAAGTAVSVGVSVDASVVVIAGYAGEVARSYAAICEAQAQTNALLGLGIGSATVTADGELVLVYNADTVTAPPALSGDGDLIITY